jgi:hypothetical protein
MYKKHTSFKEPINKNVKIWRYLDFTKFISMLDKKTLFFNRSDKFSDRFEGKYTNRQLREFSKLFVGDEEGTSEIEKENINCSLRNTFSTSYPRELVHINSWHENDFESAAMWELYLKSDEGIAIQSTFKKLTVSFPKEKKAEVYIGKVKYIDYQSENIPDDAFATYLYKRKSFEHEHEIRALTTGKYEEGAYIDVSLDTLIETIYISSCT